MTNFEETMRKLELQHEQLLTRKNTPTDVYNGIYAHSAFLALRSRPRDQSLLYGTDRDECRDECGSY